MIKRIANWTKKLKNQEIEMVTLNFYRLKKNIPYFMKDMTKEYFLANKYERAIMIIKKI